MSSLVLRTRSLSMLAAAQWNRRHRTRLPAVTCSWTWGARTLTTDHGKMGLASGKVAAFGAEMRSSQFRLDPDLTFVNHAAYGAVPQFVREHWQSLHSKVDADCLEWFHEDYCTGVPTQWRESLETVCQFIGTSYDSTVFVENTTTGINTVLKSLPFGPNDVILTSCGSYPSIKLACTKRAHDTGAEHLTIQLPDKSRNAVLKAYSDFFHANSKVKLVILDHITASSGWVMPIIDLIPLCKKHGVLVCIDGAHAPGHLPLNIEELGADFYVGNFYKWLFTPLTAGVLWIHPRHHKYIHPLVTSHKYNTTLQGAFYLLGARDFVPCCCVPKAIEFIELVGGLEAINQYSGKLADEARNVLVNSWNTESYPIPREDEAPCAKVIRMPPFDVKGINRTAIDCEKLMDIIHDRYRVRTKVVLESDSFWIRLSASIYNTWDDFVKLDAAVCDLAEIRKM